MLLIYFVIDLLLLELCSAPNWNMSMLLFSAPGVSMTSWTPCREWSVIIWPFPFSLSFPSSLTLLQSSTVALFLNGALILLKSLHIFLIHVKIKPWVKNISSGFWELPLCTRYSEASSPAGGAVVQQALWCSSSSRLFESVLLWERWKLTRVYIYIYI